MKRSELRRMIKEELMKERSGREYSRMINSLKDELARSTDKKKEKNIKAAIDQLEALIKYD